MNTPPIFALLNQSEEVRKIVFSDDILRVFKFGFADECPQMPYVVWQSVAGTAMNNLSDRPSGDSNLVQIDIYDTDAETVENLAKAVRYAIELECNITAYREIDKDPETGDYHIGFDVLWILPR